MARGELLCGDPRSELTLLGELVRLNVPGQRFALRELGLVLAYDAEGRLVIAQPSTAPRRRAAPAPRVAVRRSAPGYRGTHFGSRGTREIIEGVCGDPLEHLEFVGVLNGLWYRTTKLGDAPNSVYRHAFEKTKPILAYDRSSMLIIAGGGYRITWRGIVG